MARFVKDGALVSTPNTCLGCGCCFEVSTRLASEAIKVIAARDDHPTKTLAHTRAEPHGGPATGARRALASAESPSALRLPLPRLAGRQCPQKEAPPDARPSPTAHRRSPSPPRRYRHQMLRRIRPRRSHTVRRPGRIRQQGSPGSSEPLFAGYRYEVQHVLLAPHPRRDDRWRSRQRTLQPPASHRAP